MYKYNKSNKLRVFTAFAGYDSQCLALNRLKEHYPDFDYELVGWSEFDPESKSPLERQPAIIAHNALFPQWSDRNYGDICQIDWENVPDFDLFTYSFPCQSVSAAGKMAGLEKGSGTRSSLLWECEKAIVARKPKYLLLENVKNLLSKKFRPFYLEWVGVLDKLGYETFTQIVNAKDMGVPQNRERVFGVSILRTDDDPSPIYNFPKPFPLERRLKDVLEEKVDEKYYLSDKMLDYFNRVNDDKTHHHDFNPTDGGGAMPAPSEQHQETE